MEILSFVNQKGGVAKTTSCLNVGAALAMAGKKVLLIDLDPQGSLSKCAGIRDQEGKPTTYEVLKGDCDINDAIRTKQTATGVKYDILPTDIRMSGAEVELITAPGRDMLLKDAIEGLTRRYDYLLIDCSPSLNIFTLMALSASTQVIIPVAAQYMPLDGMAQLLPTIELVQKRINKGLKIGGVIITMYDSRRSLDKGIADAIRQAFPKQTYKTVIRYNSKLAEAPTYGADIFEYARKSNGAEDYKAVAEEIIERGKQ